MAAPPASTLDANQVLQHSYDEATGEIRVQASISTTINDVEIVDGDGNHLVVNPDGSLNANVEVDSADGDSILVVGTENGTTGGIQHVMRVSANGTVIVDATGSTVAATQSGTWNVNNLLNASGVQGSISVTTTATAARVGGANLANRKNMTVWNNGTQTLYWGYTSGVTTANGTPLMINQQLIGDWGPSTTIFLIATSGSHDVRITEGA